MNLPINVFVQPYFMQRMRAIDMYYTYIEAFEVFCKEMERYANEQDYFQHYNEVKEAVIQYLRENPVMVEFCNSELLNKIAADYNGSRYGKGSNLYSLTNNGKTFISIDMNKANFTALALYDSRIFDASSWEEFIGRFTDNKHIIASKYIRQVIMGACNPKAQVKYERILMCRLLDYLRTKIDGLDDYFYSVTNDEILFACPTDEVAEEIRKSLENKNDIYEKVLGIVPYKYEKFWLEKLNGVDGYLRHIDGGRFSFKCLPAEIYHQVLNHFRGFGNTTDDLVFIHNGKLAMFLEEVKNPWEEST